MRRLRRRAHGRWGRAGLALLVVVAVAAGALLATQLGEDSSTRASVPSLDGALTPLARKQARCLKGVGGRPNIRCRSVVKGQFDVSSLAISPDGRFAYGVSLNTGRSSGRDVPGGTIAAFARNRRSGALKQLRGRNACIRDKDAPLNLVTGSCRQRARGLSGAKKIVISPDGRFAYVAALNNDAIAAFRRNRRTGALRQLRGRDACIGTPPSGRRRECPRVASGLHGIRWIALSPDGRHLYAASPANDAIAAFSRDPRTGGLRQLQGADACIEDRLARVGGCPSKGVGLNYPRTIAISPDGRNAYVASDSADSTFPGDAADGDAVSAFARDARTGALRQLPGRGACVKDTLARSTTHCQTVGRGLLDAFHVTVSPDNRHVYVGSQASRAGAVAAFTRDATGALTQLPGEDGCVGSVPSCLPAAGIKGVDEVTISADGERAYVTAFFGLTVAVFDRDTQSGALRPLPRPGACVRDVRSREPCALTVRGLDGPRGVTLSPDGRIAYVASSVSGTIVTFRVRGAR